VTPAEVLDAIVALCREAGIDVRRVPGRPAAPGEPAARSSLCRVRGAFWLVLSDAEGPEERIGAAAAALRQVAPELLEGRYLPPAVRARLGSGPA